MIETCLFSFQLEQKYVKETTLRQLNLEETNQTPKWALLIFTMYTKIYLS